MRRSRRVGTLLAGTASLLILTACDEEQVQDPLYSDVEACAAENARNECEQAFASAKQWHEERTDRFSKREECETLFGQGNCETVSQATPVQTTPGQATASPGASSTSFFMPALMGFMLAKSMQGIGGYPSGYPLYFDRQGYAYAGGTQIGTCTPPEACQQRTGTSSSSGRTSTGSSFSSTSSRRYSVSPSSSGSVSAAAASSRSGFGASASRMSSGSSS